MTLITWLYAFIICLQIAFWLKQKERWMQKFSVSNFISSLLPCLFLFLKNPTYVLNFTGCSLISFLITAD